MSNYGIDHLFVETDSPLPPDHQIPIRGHFQRQALASGLSLPLPEYSFGLTVEQDHNLRFQHCRLYCLGFVHYWDAVGRTRLTAFCRELEIGQSASTGRFVRCNEPDYEYDD
jgi:hypothetical protein